MLNNIDIYNLRARMKDYLHDLDVDSIKSKHTDSFLLGAECVFDSLTHITGIDFNELLSTLQ